MGAYRRNSEVGVLLSQSRAFQVKWNLPMREDRLEELARRKSATGIDIGMKKCMCEFSVTQT